VGGKGLIEASSSASRAGDFFVQVESAAIELRSESMLRAAEGDGRSWSSLRTTALATGALVGITWSDTALPLGGPSLRAPNSSPATFV